MYFGNCGVKQAGYDYDDKAFEIVFNRIYAIFGSAAPYTLYEDAKPFLRWVRSQGIQVGVVSNASYRYRDVILPLLGLNQVGSPTHSVSISLKHFHPCHQLLCRGGALPCSYKYLFCRWG